MGTLVILILLASLFRFSTDLIRNLSNDSSIIILCMCVISDLHIIFGIIKMWIKNER